MRIITLLFMILLLSGCTRELPTIATEDSRLSRRGAQLLFEGNPLDGRLVK